MLVIGLSYVKLNIVNNYKTSVYTFNVNLMLCECNLNVNFYLYL